MICSWSQDYRSLISGQSPFTAILGGPSPSCPWGSCLLGPQTLLFLKNKKALVRPQWAEETGCGGLSLMEGAYWCQDKTVANIKPMLQLSMGLRAQVGWNRQCNTTTQHQFTSIAQSLRPHGWQHARLPCPSPNLWACSDSCPLGRWCHPTISSSVIPFSSCPQSFPSSGSFPVSQFFTSGGQSIGASASASVLPMNIQDWSPLGWTGWISLQSKGLSRVFSNSTIQKHQFFGAQFSLWSYII